MSLPFILVWVLWLWLGRKAGVWTNRAAVLATAIPPTLLEMAFFVYAVLNRGEAFRNTEVSHPVYICMFVGNGLVVAAFLSSIVFAIRRKWEIAKGTGYGSVIGSAACLIAFISEFVFYYGSD